MPVVDAKVIPATPPWASWRCTIVHPSTGDRYFLFLSTRQTLTSAGAPAFRISAFCNKPGSTLSTPDATQEAATLADWDAPADILLSVVHHWGEHTYHPEAPECPAALLEPLRALIAGHIDPAAFRARLLEEQP